MSLNDVSTVGGQDHVLLRAKYLLYDTPAVQLAGALQVRLPTGDEDDLMGLPRVGVQPLLIASGEVPIGDAIFSPHFNLGYEINSGANKQDELDYAIGFEYGRPILGDFVTLIADVLGSHETKNKDGIGDDIVDFSIGLKWSFSRDNLLFVNVIVPLNEEGLRADAIPTIGYQVTF